ncbi:nucleolar complex protein 4 [Monosporozyma unispora]|nr:Maturation and nuclear export of 40S ribosomal subunits interacting protein [Kazachstania unispora]
MSLSIEEIKSIAKIITSSKDKTNYNNIIKLINDLSIPLTNQQSLIDQPEQEKTLRFLIVSLFQIFKKLFQRNELVIITKTTQNHTKLKFIQWCQKMYNSFKLKLLSIISELTIETSLALDSLDLYMQLIELESGMSSGPFFPNKTLKNLIIAIWKSNIISNEINITNGQSINFILIEFLNKYYLNYTDIQYYTQSELNKLFELNEISKQNNIAKWLTLMNHDKHYGIIDDAKDDFEVFVLNPPQAMENISKFKSLLEKNWLHQLNQNLSFNQYKTILLILHKRIIPFFHTPTKLMDFLTDSYNLTTKFPNDKSIGVIPILSLNGLFQLMQSSNLEYPNFYQKLYQLLTPDLMHVKYRPRFFRLMELFLSSTHLSVHLIASFIKKLARLSLTAPPSAIVTVIPFIYNMLKKHPNCMIMIHNPRFISNPFQTPEEIAQLKQNIKDYNDPFDMNCLDPELTHAFESSLWELSTLMEHYHPNVATLARIFKQPFRKLHYNMEDFLDWNYDSLINAELSRNLKILPTLEFESFETTLLNETDSEEHKSTYLENIAW